MELNSRNLGSRCEAVIVVLQGLMSSEVELVPGGMTGDVTGSELAEVCQQSHVSVMGHNMESFPLLQKLEVRHRHCVDKEGDVVKEKEYSSVGFLYCSETVDS